MLYWRERTTLFQSAPSASLMESFKISITHCGFSIREISACHVDGVDYLKADYTKICWVQGSKHELAFIGAIVAMVVYVFGIPFAMFMSLFLNRKHIHDPESKHYMQLREGLGSLFVQYEPGGLKVMRERLRAPRES